VNATGLSAADLARRLLEGVRRVQEDLGWTGPCPAGIHDRFADLVDSMGLVEFLLQTAEDCGTTPDAIESCVQRQFSTVWELAQAMHAAGLVPRGTATPTPSAGYSEGVPPMAIGSWLGPVSVRLPSRVQSAAEIDAVLRRPAGWLEQRAGIQSRRLWGTEDPLAAAADAGREALERASVKPTAVGALLVTSEAPPLLLGLAAAMHHRLALPAGAVALEVGGACTGFLAALWLGRQLLAGVGTVLIIAVEAPSRILQFTPGAPGEVAALFGDGVAACVLSGQTSSAAAVPLIDIALGADGSAGHLLTAETRAGSLSLQMDGQALAGRAVRVMADKSRVLLGQHSLTLAKVQAVIAHGGNGRMPALLARKLGIPPEQVWSEASRVGNLGAATLPVAWAARGPAPGPALWTAVGAGLTWASALTGARSVP
jgi:3-oxoacyl-[acyl-carrier-protein] synthase-3